MWYPQKVQNLLQTMSMFPNIKKTNLKRAGKQCLHKCEQTFDPPFHQMACTQTNNTSTESTKLYPHCRRSFCSFVHYLNSICGDAITSMMPSPLIKLASFWYQDSLHRLNLQRNNSLCVFFQQKPQMLKHESQTDLNYIYLVRQVVKMAKFISKCCRFLTYIFKVMELNSTLIHLHINKFKPILNFILF